MHYQLLMILVTLAAFAAASTAAAVCAALSWSRLEARLTRVSSVARARLLFLLRVGPVLAGGVASAITILGFVRHEPRTTLETPGTILLAAAAAGIVFAMAAVCRVVVRGRTTYRFLHTVERTARRVTVPGISLRVLQVDTSFPLVALAGIRQPRLLIARCVLEQVPDHELQVILKHELAHARRCDNLARLLLTGLPDALSLVQGRLGIDRAWHQAAEDAADDLASGDDLQTRLCLASALIRVARMAGPQGAAIPLLAFHGGESVERRVRRLLHTAEPRPDPSLPPAFMTLTLVSGALALWLGADPVLLRMHHAIEWLVNARL
jgi:Zn-dependent protease with chaperone function